MARKKSSPRWGRARISSRLRPSGAVGCSRSREMRLGVTTSSSSITGVGSSSMASDRCPSSATTSWRNLWARNPGARASRVQGPGPGSTKAKFPSSSQRTSSCDSMIWTRAPGSGDESRLDSTVPRIDDRPTTGGAGPGSTTMVPFGPSRAVSRWGASSSSRIPRGSVAIGSTATRISGRTTLLVKTILSPRSVRSRSASVRVLPT